MKVILTSILFVILFGNKLIAQEEYTRPVIDRIDSLIQAYQEDKNTVNLSEALRLTRSVEGTKYNQRYEKVTFSENKRIRKILEIAKILSDDIDEDFDINDYPSQNITSTVSSMENNVAIISGMSPEHIKDPKEKANYIEALRKNHEKFDNIRIQGYLRKIEKHALWIIEIELKNLITIGGDYVEILSFLQNQCDCSKEFLQKLAEILQIQESKLILKISQQDSYSRTLLFQLENSRKTSFFAPLFNTSENLVDIYSPEGNKISFSFIVCGDYEGLHEEIAPGHSKVWTYDIVHDFFENPLGGNKLEKGVYKIIWSVGGVSTEYDYSYN